MVNGSPFDGAQGRYAKPFGGQHYPSGALAGKSDSGK